jgi:ATP-dependent Clp protease adaptor protein ClpS
MSTRDPGFDDEIEIKNREETEESLTEPPLFRVVLHNDDFTPMNFVVFILEEVFQYSFDEAMVIMLKVHQSGKGIVGVYPYEIAETKVAKAIRLAKTEGYPLFLDLEEDS